jgi:carbamoylphosphate synthase large subunit
MNILCISTYFKGVEFLKTAYAEGNQVYLVTNKKLEHKPWPRECLAEVFYLEKIENTSEVMDTLLAGVVNIFRQTKIDVIVALDDFDVEKAAMLRENFRINGMGQTTARYFRDKLAMRMQARSKNVHVPAFSALFHDIDITEFIQNTEGPWLVKPRSEASATGIKKVHNIDEAWQHIHSLGDFRHNYLIECFKPGDVYHVDALIVNSKIVFEQCSQYLNTPFEVAHGGGIFRSLTVDYESDDYAALCEVNKDVIAAFNMKNGVVHTEVIKNKETGEFYFLETASRVGGAHLAEMVEAATEINLWAEWAKIETAVFEKTKYTVPKRKQNYGGILVTLSSQQWPDYKIFTDKEICWTMNEEYHIGVILQNNKRETVIKLLDKYVQIISEKGLHASAPAPDKPTH